MKRFFMYCIVIIGTVFVGLAFYMFARNNEYIECTVAQGETIYLNVGEQIDVPINHTKKDKRTEIEVTTDNSNAVEIKDGKISALSYGGTAVITITPSNENFGPFNFTIRVGNGTNENPYFIKTAQQLCNIGNEASWGLDNCYEVVANIDLKDTWADGKEKSWTPIGTESKPFTGVFNGGTKTISNVKISDTENAKYVGLFGCVGAGARIERVTLSEPQISTSGNNVGAIAGYSKGIITRCRIIDGSVSSTSDDSFVGGIVGVAERGLTENEISMCQVDNATINGNTVGGIAGKFVSGVIANCKVVATLASEKKATCAGGLVGTIDAGMFTQTFNGEEKTYPYNSLIQTNLVVLTIGEQGATNLGAMIYDTLSESGKTTNYVGNIFCSNIVTGNENQAQTLSEQDLSVQDKFQYTKNKNTIKWDFDGTWSLENKVDGDTVGPYIIQDGLGQTVRPLRSGISIEDEGQAKDILSQLMNATEKGNDTILSYVYVVKNDVELDVSEAFKDGWKPIGNSLHPFDGQFYGEDGATLTLKNVTIPSGNITECVVKDVTEKTAGIFGCTSQNAHVSNIAVQGLTIESDDTAIVGGLVGKNQGYLANCSVSELTINNGQYVGAIAGKNLTTAGMITNCEVESGKIISKRESGSTCYVGGAVGENQGAISLCSADVTIEASVTSKETYVGGIAGTNHGKITSCTKVGGNITAGGSVVRLGGIVGFNGKTGEIKSSNCETSSLSAPKSGDNYAGGIVGQNDGKATGCYFSGSIESKNVGGIVGTITSGEIKECGSESTLTGTNVGGITYRCQGYISDCYFEASDKVAFDEEYAGLTIKLPYGGYITHCYVSTTSGFSTSANSNKLHHDISTDIKTNFKKIGDRTQLFFGKFGSNTSNFFQKLFQGEFNEQLLGDTSYTEFEPYGAIDNNIINTYNAGRGTWDGFTEFWSTVGKDSGWDFVGVDIDPNAGAFIASEFINHGFSSAIWNFEGESPKLQNATSSIGAEIVVSLEGADENVAFDGSTLTINNFSEEKTISLLVTIAGATTISADSTGDVVEYVLEGEKLTIKALKAGEQLVTITAGDAIYEFNVVVSAA